MDRAFASDLRFLPTWAARNLEGQQQEGEQERQESYGAVNYISLEDWKLQSSSAGYYNLHEDEDDAFSVASLELDGPRTPEYLQVVNSSEPLPVTIIDMPSRGTFFPEMV
jgi:hypothetical protein